MSILSQHGESLAEAMNADFGSRSFEGSMMTDIVSTIGFGKYCLKNMDHWAAPDKRSVRFPLGLMGAKAEVRYEPKGVIGIMSPWNFPVNLSFGPLMQVLAAGNRAMIKPSEFTPATSDRMRELVADVFDEDEVAVVTGGPDVAQAFSSLPFDHLVFTGSTATGRKVMEAAAKNLVPVTLELGGKSPTIIGKGADLTRAGERIALGKMLNAGQICLAPDYLLVPEDQEEGVVAAVQLGVHQMYPTLLDNEDYTAIISDKHFERLKGIDLEVHAGEILGIAGVAGNGQSELLEVLGGYRDATGEVRLNGDVIDLTGKKSDGQSRRKRGIAHVPEDRQREGLIMDYHAWENVAFGYHHDAAYQSGILMNNAAIKADTERKMEKFDVRPPDPNLAAKNFSGGNQQKIVVAREIERNPDLLLVGQPTRGVDIGAIEFIHQQIVSLREAGKAVLLVSVELDEILSLADRVAVMFDGVIMGERRASETDEKELGLLMAGITEMPDKPIIDAVEEQLAAKEAREAKQHG